MSESNSHPEPCQVDFYLLGEHAAESGEFACQLALMAWERKQDIFIVTDTAASSHQLNELMWQYPEGRFLPHALSSDSDASTVPIRIGTLSGLNPVDVVINLCHEAVPEPERFSRVLEIVPFANEERQASRVKYKTYRNLGITPQTHEINN